MTFINEIPLQRQFKSICRYTKTQQISVPEIMKTSQKLRVMNITSFRSQYMYIYFNIRNPTPTASNLTCLKDIKTSAAKKPLIPKIPAECHIT